MSDFDDLIDRSTVSAGEESRLRRAHELLVAAGPPPDLPPRLAHPADVRGADDAEILQFPLLPKRRWAVAAVATAALVLAAFLGGYLLGSGHGHTSAFHTVRSLELRGDGTAFAGLQLGSSDSVGNWPMILSVTGLPKQKVRGDYYELFLTRHGRPTIPCGGFRVLGTSTVVRFSVPYAAHAGDRWVVTAQPAGHHEPGRVVLST